MPAKDRFPTLRRIARAVRSRTPGLALVGLLLVATAGLAQVPPPPPSQPSRPAPASSGPVLVSDVIIQGNRLVSTESIRGQMKTRAGREFVAETLQEDVR